MDKPDHQFSADIKARMRFIAAPNAFLHRHEWRYWCSEAKAFAREYQKLQAKLDRAVEGLNYASDSINIILRNVNPTTVQDTKALQEVLALQGNILQLLTEINNESTTNGQ